MDRATLAQNEGCYFDESQPNKICDWIQKNCPLTLGPQAGQTRQLIPWCRTAIEEIYGWHRPDNQRLTREAYLWMPKKNAKSYLSSSLALWTAANIRGSMTEIIASSVYQAGIIYNECVRQLKYGINEHDIGKGFHWRYVKNQIFYYDDDGFESKIHILPGTPKISGHPYHLCLCDEFIDVKNSWVEEIYNTIKSGGAATNGLLIFTSTPKFDLSHFCYHKWMASKEALTECKDSSTYHLLYTIPQDAECLCPDKKHGEGWRCVEWWKKANPGIGYSIPEQDFHNAYASVLANPREQTEFCTLRCGQWLSRVNCWIPLHKWNACKTTLPEKDLWGSDIILGIDGARKHDLCACVGIVKKNDEYHLLDRCWIPGMNAAKKEQIDSFPYRKYEKEGWVKFCDGEEIRIEDIYQEILDFNEHFRIVEIRMDQRGLWDWADKLKNEFPMFFVDQQPLAMASPATRFEQLVLNGKIKHSGSPVFKWCVDGVVPSIKGNDLVYITKRLASHRIDIVQASIIAMTYFMQDTSLEWKWEGAFCDGW